MGVNNILFIVSATAAVAFTIPHGRIAIDPTSYHFEYGVHDPNTHDVKTQYERKQGKQVVGGYTVKTLHPVHGHHKEIDGYKAGDGQVATSYIAFTQLINVNNNKIDGNSRQNEYSVQENQNDVHNDNRGIIRHNDGKSDAEHERNVAIIVEHDGIANHGTRRESNGGVVGRKGHASHGSAGGYNGGVSHSTQDQRSHQSHGRDGINSDQLSNNGNPSNELFADRNKDDSDSHSNSDRYKDDEVQNGKRGGESGATYNVSVSHSTQDPGSHKSRGGDTINSDQISNNGNARNEWFADHSKDDGHRKSGGLKNDDDYSAQEKNEVQDGERGKHVEYIEQEGHADYSSHEHAGGDVRGSNEDHSADSENEDNGSYHKSHEDDNKDLVDVGNEEDDDHDNENSIGDSLYNMGESDEDKDDFSNWFTLDEEDDYDDDNDNYDNFDKGENEEHHGYHENKINEQLGDRGEVEARTRPKEIEMNEGNSQLN